MKALFVGDVHNHSYMFADIAIMDQQENFDRIIFMGDYVDDWNTDNHQSLMTLEKIFSLKESNPNKYTFLVGNHELSYLGYPCAGHQNNLDDIMELQLKEHIDYFDFYTSIVCGDKEYICTHAGLTSGYINQCLNGTNWRETLDDMNKHKLQNLELLSYCSSIRGGRDEYSSFVWTDFREHRTARFFDSTIPYQIVGHTPVRTVINEFGIYFIDTHSTYRDGSLYGDKSYLMWNETKFEVIK